MTYIDPLRHCTNCGRPRADGHHPDCPVVRDETLNPWLRVLFPVAAVLILIGILFLAASCKASPDDDAALAALAIAKAQQAPRAPQALPVRGHDHKALAKPVGYGACQCWNVVEYDEHHRPVRMAYGPCKGCACDYSKCQYDGKPHEADPAAKAQAPPVKAHDHGAVTDAYVRARARALQENRPLLVYVGQRPDPWYDWLWLRVEQFPGARAPCVVLGIPEDGDLTRAADLPGRPTRGQILEALRPKPVPRAFVPPPVPFGFFGGRRGGGSC